MCDRRIFFFSVVEFEEGCRLTEWIIATTSVRLGLDRCRWSTSDIISHSSTLKERII